MELTVNTFQKIEEHGGKPCWLAGLWVGDDCIMLIYEIEHWYPWNEIK